MNLDEKYNKYKKEVDQIYDILQGFHNDEVDDILKMAKLKVDADYQ